MSAAKTRWAITSDQFLSPEQISRLLDYLTRERDLALARQSNFQAVREYYMIRGLLETGLRVAEFCDLIESDFQGLRLAVRNGKGGKSRTVLLTRPTANLFKEWLILKASLGFKSGLTAPLFPSRYDKRYTTRGVQKRVKVIFAALEFPTNLSVHSLRHTNCSLLLASGKVGLGTVRDNLGHHSIAVTNLYTHATGNLDDVELYPAASSEKTEFSELRRGSGSKKRSDFVRGMLRNANLKRNVR